MGGPVEHNLPQGHELETIQEIIKEHGGTESFPDDVAGELRVVRYLRGRSGNKTEAAAMLRKALEWRSREVNFKVEDLRSAVAGLSLEEYQRHFAAKPERSYLPAAFLGRSKAGCPVLFCKAGKWDIGGLEEKFGGASLFKHEVEYMEWIMNYMHGCSEKEGWLQYIFVILDLEGANWRQLRGTSRKLLIQSQKDIMSLYCDAVEVTVVINAPRIFQVAWQIAPPLLSERQKAKLHVLGNASAEATQAALHSAISPEYLPISLGGAAEPDVWGCNQNTGMQKQRKGCEDENTRSSTMSCMSCFPCCFYRPEKKSKQACSILEIPSPCTQKIQTSEKLGTNGVYKDAYSSTKNVQQWQYPLSSFVLMMGLLAVYYLQDQLYSIS